MGQYGSLALTLRGYLSDTIYGSPMAMDEDGSTETLSHSMSEGATRALLARVVPERPRGMIVHYGTVLMIDTIIE